MSKPPIIVMLEEAHGLSISAVEDMALPEFLRYGRREQVRNQYLMEGGQLIGLKLRSNGDKLRHFDVPRSALQELRALILTENALESLVLPDMPALEYLDISDNQPLTTLRLEGTLPRLRELDASDSGLSALRLPHCPALEKLDVSRNAIGDFGFESACPALRWLDLSGNEGLRKVTLPGGFSQLTYLHLSECGLEQLDIKEVLPKLQVLDLEKTRLEKLPADIILDSPLENLYAEGNRPKNIPWPFLGKKDSLANARTWFQELRDYPSKPNKTVKLMVTGNGNVGKTTLICALQNEENDYACQEAYDSTHGVQIGHWEQPGITYNYWDFGGQEVYHGTHRLFLASEALQLLVFDPETEQFARANQRVQDRIRKEDAIINHPIAYWYEMAATLSQHSPFLLVQNKKTVDTEIDSTVEDYAKQHKIQLLHVDAKTGADVEDIPHYLKKLTKQLPDYGMLMPSSWLDVRQHFMDNLEQNTPERLMPLDVFEGELCKDIRPQSRALLLQYLHHSGFLYRHEKLGNTLIMDQRWALDAIYKPLDRGAPHYAEFRDDYEGKIRVRRLFDIFGTDYKESEKWLFLSFMESCGLCFELNRKKGEHEAASLSDVYVFPEFLPADQPEGLKAEWEKAKDVVVLRYKMPWVNYALVQAFISALGRKTSERSIWRNGIKVRTAEGWFQAELKYEERALLLSIEKQAMAHWIKPILEAFPSDIKWEIAEDGGDRFVPFDLEQWQRRAKEQPTVAIRGGEESERALAKLADVPQQLDRDVMLFLSANPAIDPKVSFEGEYYHIDKELKKKDCRGKIEPIPKDNISLYDLTAATDEEQPTIVHFVGHGEEADPDTKTGGGLRVFSDNRREVEVIDAPHLAEIFRKIKYQQPQLSLVFLNACFTEPQARAISLAGLYAFGTADKIGSVDARRVAMGFYKKYALTKDVKLAAEHACTILRDSSLIRLFHCGQEIKLYQA